MGNFTDCNDILGEADGTKMSTFDLIQTLYRLQKHPFNSVLVSYTELLAVNMRPLDIKYCERG